MVSKAQDHIEPERTNTLDDQLDHSKAMNEVAKNAKNASDKEHAMTLWQGIKLYPKAVAWSILISTCIVMEGYDVCLLSNFCKWQEKLALGRDTSSSNTTVAFPQFNKKYGEMLPDGSYQITAAWQAGLSNVSIYLSGHVTILLADSSSSHRVSLSVRLSVFSSTVTSRKSLDIVTRLSSACF